MRMIQCIAALALSLALAGCRTAPPSQPSDRRPIVVWMQTDPWLLVIGSDTPRLVLYDDGEAIFRR